MKEIDGVSLVIGDIRKKKIRFLLEKQNDFFPFYLNCYSPVIAEVRKKDQELFDEIKKKYGLITSNMYYQLIALRFLIEEELLIPSLDQDIIDPYEKIKHIDQFQLCLFLHSLHECGEYVFFSEKKNKNVAIKQYFFNPPYSIKTNKKNAKWFNFHKIIKRISKTRMCLNPLSNFFFEEYYLQKQKLFYVLKKLEKVEEKIKINPYLWIFKHRSPTIPPDKYVNTYVIGNQHKYIIDPAADGKKELLRTGFLNFIEKHLQEIDGIILTHEHLDHSNQIEYLKYKYDIPVYASKESTIRVREITGFEFDGYLSNNQVIELGNIPFSQNKWELQVINLNGHTNGSLGFLDKARGFLFSGDFLFEDRQTIIDPHYGSLQKLRENMKMLLKYRITYVHPGHGDIFEFNKELVKANIKELDIQEKRVKDCVKLGSTSIDDIVKCAFSDKMSQTGRLLAIAHIQSMLEKDLLMKRGEDYILRERKRLLSLRR